ncbi:MAG: aminotransferase class I/II-fold pyridoxal phosphate-dependent enzyme, partial [Gammaproteobacteria bacterium]
LETRAGAQGVEVIVGGRRLKNFSSNDYLGLAADPRVIDAVRAALAREGFGSGAAALLSGRSALHEALEERLCAFTGAEAALLFSSGYLANLGALPALVRRGDLVHHDRLNHASLIDGVLASGARHRRYPHGTLPALGAAADQTEFVVTESVFSMDGDEAPLAELARTAADANAILYVDDAHGIGVTAGGRGAAARLASAPQATSLLMLTFGKALASAGAAVLGPRLLIDFLVQRARTFVYDTAPPPACAAAALAALDVIEHDASLTQRLTGNIALFRAAAAAAGLGLLPSETPIQPLMVGTDGAALALAAELRDAGFYVRAIRPPTVPRGTARLRFTITAAHAPGDIEALVEACAARLAA